MTPELLFSLVNLSVMPAWAMLILAPRWRGTEAVVHSMAYPLLLGGVYFFGLMATIFLAPNTLWGGAEGAGFSSISAVRQIFASDMGLIVGWTHFLVFDLFVGAWCARDAKARGFKHALLIPCLIGCFMFGPLGLVLYLGLRKVTGTGGWGLDAGLVK